MSSWHKAPALGSCSSRESSAEHVLGHNLLSKFPQLALGDFPQLALRLPTAWEIPYAMREAMTVWDCARFTTPSRRAYGGIRGPPGGGVWGSA